MFFFLNTVYIYIARGHRLTISNVQNVSVTREREMTREVILKIGKFG